MIKRASIYINTNLVVTVLSQKHNRETRGDSWGPGLDPRVWGKNKNIPKGQRGLSTVMSTRCGGRLRRGTKAVLSLFYKSLDSRDHCIYKFMNDKDTINTHNLQATKVLVENDSPTLTSTACFNTCFESQAQCPSVPPPSSWIKSELPH